VAVVAVPVARAAAAEEAKPKGNGDVSLVELNYQIFKL
jgi:hypothetical protein